MTKTWTKDLLALLVHVEMDVRGQFKNIGTQIKEKEKESANDSIIYLVAIS